MGIVSRMLAPRSRRSASPYVDAFLRGDDLPNAWGRGGRPVTDCDALGVVSVYACVRVIAETLASLPLVTYRRLEPRGRTRDTGHPLFWLLHDSPNPEMSRMTFWEAIVGHATLRGTGYAEIQRDQDDRPIALWPLRPDRMRVDRTAAGRLFYRYRLTTGPEKIFDQRDILNVPGFGSNGIVGFSPIELHAQAIGLASDAEGFASRFFQNDSTPGGVLQGDKEMSDAAYERLKASWEQTHQGVGQSHRMAILEEGFTWQQVGLHGREVQFIEQRRFSVEEIARLFRVPLHLIQELSHATFTNIEHQSIDFVVHTIRPWAERVEAAIERCLLSPAERRTHYVEHLVDGLLRGDIKTRYEAYAVSRVNGWNNANDIRELENQNPLPDGQGGDTYWAPLNMVPAGQLGQEIADPGDGARTVRSLRAAGSAAGRLRLAERYERLFTDAAGRIVAREVNDLQQAADRHLNRRDAESFQAWLRDYYERLAPIAARTILPVMLSYAEVVLEDAAAEIGSDDAEADALQPFVEAYARDFGEHHAGQSRTLAEQALARAAGRGEDALLAITTLLAEWRANRAGQVASIETVRLSGALTIERWDRGGVTRVRWVRQGSRSCPFCARLNGRIVGIRQTFADVGQEIEGDDQTPPLRVQRKTTHPPIHGACKCGLRPERG